MKAVVLLAVALTAAACGGSSAPVAAIEPSVARLAGTVCGDPLYAGAVVIDTGFVLTAAHVIAGAGTEVSVHLATGEERTGRVVGFDAERDLALIFADGLSAPPVPLGPGGAAAGDGVIVAVSRDDETVVVPFTVEREITATGDDIYGEGDVSRRALELSADVVPGLSGAGAFDERGRLIGVVFAESRERPITYAVALSEIETFLGEEHPPVANTRCR